ncbi:hypothetical protein [Deinococcus sp. QL22]|uniref:hypothetical protein n=1 Tax=Deinococcus sp. QL22 TaxID=2939437 RepID=UPI0020173E7F|nr:hypothetical protein [Deinococcus sp. QL22]UQN09587.1 hypothetical protein M1R55_25920 [Deinococcus sp. QL22]
MTLGAPPDWTSLGAQVSAETLPLSLQQELVQRWATPFRPTGAYRIDLHVAPLPPPPLGPAREASLSTSTVRVRGSGTQVWIGAGLYLQVGADHTQITVQPQAVHGADWLLAFGEAHRASGWLPLHAAAVAQAGRAVAVSGVSGAGKSTAALRLAGAGLTVLAEDQTWVHPAAAEVVGLDRFLRAFPDSVGRFAPQQLEQDVKADTDGKLLLPLQPQREPAHLKALLIFGLPPRPTRAERVRALWEMTGVPLTPVAQQRSAQAVSEFVQRLPLEGTDRDGVVAQVGEWLELPLLRM